MIINYKLYLLFEYVTALLEYLDLVHLTSNADPGPCCIPFCINPLIIPWKDVYKVGL